MTPEELWRAVGEVLLLYRTRRGWNPVDVERAGGPTYKTVQLNERGELSSVSKLAQHADALGISIVDVFREALAQTATPVTVEAATLVRAYEQASVAGRQVLVMMAQALLEQSTPSTPHRSPPAPAGSGKRKP